MESAFNDADEDADYYGQLTALYQQNAQHSEAVELYRRALNLRSAEAKWWIGMGISLEHKDQIRKARSAYRNARNSGRLAPELLKFVNERIELIK